MPECLVRMENYVVVLLHVSRQQNLKPHSKKKRRRTRVPCAPERCVRSRSSLCSVCHPEQHVFCLVPAFIHFYSQDPYGKRCRSIRAVSEGSRDILEKKKVIVDTARDLILVKIS